MCLEKQRILKRRKVSVFGRNYQGRVRWGEEDQLSICTVPGTMTVPTDPEAQVAS